MANYKDLLHQTFENEFDMGRFQNFIVQFFNNSRIVAPNKKYQDYHNWNEYSYYINGFYNVAEYIDPNRNKIAVLAVELKKGKSLEKARSKQRNFVADRIKNMECDGAITAFYSEDTKETKWRLSFVRLDYEFLKGKVKSNLTPAKRFSYLVGKGEPCHTAMQQLLPILEEEKFNPTIDKIEEAFSVEGVTKQFFEKYREKYFEIKECLMSRSVFIEEAGRCIKSDDKNEIEKFAEQFAKKLMGQIAFMYFLQKKGWLGVNAIPQTLTEAQWKNLYFYSALTRKFADKLYVKISDTEYKLNSSVLNKLTEDEEIAVASAVKGQNWGTGPKDFVRKLFDLAIKQKKDYFNDYLEPLFYEALNEKRSANNYFVKLHCRIPFLNGGLFDPYYDYKHTNFEIPNEIFSNRDIKGERDADGILDIFDRYNFTINEDEPLEKEVAVDPEMLGKIFENLLDAKDRKSKGAFYTPREIVHYMCQESLINYLVNTVKTPYEDTKDFILYGEIMKDEDCKTQVRDEILRYNKTSQLIPDSIYEKLTEIDNALADVRVADPAVGSGAFPMGMINEIVKARDVITEYNARQIDIDGKRQGKSEQQINFLKAKEHNDRNLYNLKRDAMFNSIYAVDIEPSAVDIAKLRLWLSLVVEFEVTPDEPNPPTLPNLDCHILCGNSLIDEFEGIKLFDDKILTGSGDLISGLYVNMFEKLYMAERDFFYAQNHEDKKRFKDDIEKLKLSIMQSALSGTSNETKERFLGTRNMASKPYTLWKLEFSKVFKDKGGFDIVIGNPPYVGESGNKEIFRPIANTEFGKKYYQGKMDLFYFFFHLALDLLNSRGENAFITTNYYLNATGAFNLRKDIYNRSKIRRLINFNEYKVFDTAKGQHNIITFLTKNINDCDKTIVISTQQAGECNIEIINNILHENAKYCKSIVLDSKSIFKGDKFYIETNTDSESFTILNKLKSLPLKLGEVFEVNQGVVTGCDYVSNRNLNKIKNLNDVCINDGIFVLNMENERDLNVINNLSEGKKLLRDFYKNSDIKRYIANDKPTKKIIYYSGALNSKLYPDIYKHLLKFEDVLKERLITYNEKYDWTQIHRSRQENIFCGPKIVAPYRSKENSFAYNDVEWFCRSDAYVITPKTKDFSLFLLLAILNSKLYYYWLCNEGKKKGDVLELMQEPLKLIPLPIIDQELGSQIEEMVGKIILDKKNDKNTDILENKIDTLIYKTIGLTPEEIKIVEES